MKHALIVAVTALVLFTGYAYVGAYAQALSIELALRHVANFGKLEPVLGEFITAIPLGCMGGLAFFVLRLQPAVTYISLGAIGCVVVSFILVPSWPSNNLIRVAGELVFIFGVVVGAWASLKALSRSSRRASRAA